MINPVRTDRSSDANAVRTDRSSAPPTARDLRKFYNIREPKEGEVITYDRWYYITYGIIDGLNYESNKTSQENK
jgi:hypothetical protein